MKREKEKEEKNIPLIQINNQQ